METRLEPANGRVYQRDPKGTTTGGQFTTGSATPTATQQPASTFTPYAPTKTKGGGTAPAAPRASSKFKTLAPGEDNDPQAVAEMQQLLTALGLGNVTSGTYDQATQDAVSAAQTRLGIKPNGKANRALVDKMLAAYDLSPCVKR